MATRYHLYWELTAIPLAQPLQINRAEKHLGSFRVKEQFPLRVAGPLAGVALFAIQNVSDLVARTDAPQPVPFANGLFDILFATEAFHVLPLRVAAVPVNASGLERHGRSAGLVINFLATFFRLYRQA